MEGDGAVDDAAAESKGTGEVNSNICCTIHPDCFVQITLPLNTSRGLGTGSPAVPNSNSDEPPEQLYATQLSQLQENIRALTAAFGNVHEAVKRLSGNSS